MPAHPPKSTLSTIVFVTGLAAAAGAGVAAYRTVGLYGDGPFAGGYRRIRDPQTGRSLLVHETRTPQGTIRRVIEGRSLAGLELQEAGGRLHVQLQDGRISRVDRDTDGDGRTDRWEYYDAAGALVKVGFSLGKDGVLDAWAYHDPAGRLARVEISTRRDDRIDRREYYADGRLARVEEDTDRDGRPDRWLHYEAGILVRTEIDADRDGRPDPPPAPLPIPRVP